MECKQCLSNLSEFLDRRLEAPLAQAVESHVSSCPGCRERLADYGLLDSLLVSALPEVEPPRERMWAAVSARLPQAAPRSSWLTQTLRAVLSNSLILAPIPVALLLVALYWGQTKPPVREAAAPVGIARHTSPEEINQQRLDRIELGFRVYSRKLLDKNGLR